MTNNTSVNKIFFLCCLSCIFLQTIQSVGVCWEKYYFWDLTVIDRRSLVIKIIKIFPVHKQTCGGAPCWYASTTCTRFIRPWTWALVTKERRRRRRRKKERERERERNKKIKISLSLKSHIYKGLYINCWIWHSLANKLKIANPQQQ